MIKCILLLLILLIIPQTGIGQKADIIPLPKEMFIGNGALELNNPVLIQYDKYTEKSCLYLSDYLSRTYGIGVEKELLIEGNTVHKTGSIYLKYDHVYESEGYSMQSEKQGITINGSEPGIFYGIQTLIQLLPASSSVPLEVPFVTIRDSPRFQYRGMLLDVSRHFFDVDFVKRFIDYLALHKMNYFHWHLTDDQGWRIHINKYPELTRTGAWREGTMTGLWPGKGTDGIRHGGYYTQEEIREIVKYAEDRYITIIPEIEMPGHSLAALASYPFLGCTGGPYSVKQSWGAGEDVYCAGNEKTYEFLEDVLDEVMDLFPSVYIHIGGDECPKERWEQCLFCQQKKRNENLKDEHELQSYFVHRIEKYLNQHGRILVGWDEILEGGLAPNAVVMSWRGESGGIKAAEMDHNVIMTPSSYCYFDYRQKENEDSITAGWIDYTITVERVYNYDPVAADIKPDKAHFILGAQGNVWTEYMNNPKKVEYMIFPRMSALSETLWTPKELKNQKCFEIRLETQLARYRLWNMSFNEE